MFNMFLGAIFLEPQNPHFFSRVDRLVAGLFRSGTVQMYRLDFGRLQDSGFNVILVTGILGPGG